MFKKVLKLVRKNNGSLIYVGALKYFIRPTKYANIKGYEVKRYIVYKTKEVKVIDEIIKKSY